MINTISAAQLADSVVPDHNNQLLKSYRNTDAFVIRATTSLHINVKRAQSEPNHIRSSNDTHSIYFAHFLLNSINSGAPITKHPSLQVCSYYACQE